jgi:hypothetical protein
MSFGLLRLLYDGIDIENEACVGKSFPGFWAELARFKAHHETEGAGDGVIKSSSPVVELH